MLSGGGASSSSSGGWQPRRAMSVSALFNGFKWPFGGGADAAGVQPLTPQWSCWFLWGGGGVTRVCCHEWRGA